MSHLSQQAQQRLDEAYDTLRRESVSLQPITVYLARTGKKLAVQAKSWQQAIQHLGKADACVIKQTGDRAFQASMLADGEALTLTCRLHDGTDDDALAFVLANAAHLVDTEEARS